MRFSDGLLGEENTRQRKSFGMRKRQEPMRLVASQNGELRHVNESFAACFGLGVDDLVGRNILDMVIFKNPDEIQSDRAIFNHMNDENYAFLSGLQTGAYIVFLGSNQKPHHFHFDWITGQDGKKFLVASSISEAKPEEWTHFREDMLQERVAAQDNYSDIES